MTCHYNRSQPVSAFVVNRLVNGLFRCMRSCEIFELRQVVLPILDISLSKRSCHCHNLKLINHESWLMMIMKLSRFNQSWFYSQSSLTQESFHCTSLITRHIFWYKWKNKLHIIWRVTSMLETKCVGNKFEMMVTDSECWWLIQYIEKINITKKSPT